MFVKAAVNRIVAVSYTHLDVYKRQEHSTPRTPNYKKHQDLQEHQTKATK